MLNSSTEVIHTKKSIGLTPYRYVLFNKMVKHDQYYENVGRRNVRLEKSVPNMQQVIHTDMERMKINKVYERKLNHDLTGPKGLNWQCKQELQRLRSDERSIKRDLTKIASSSSSISPSSPLFRNQISRLSSIAEENFPTSTIDKTKSRLSSINPNRTSLNHKTTIQKRSSLNKINPHNEHYHKLFKYNFQQIIAKTSDDRPYLQQNAHIINQQKRLIEQKIKPFLH